METTKTKVLDIQTGKAQKNVKSLKQVIKELRDEMALLEKGTAEYDAMSKKLADAMQKQKEIAEAAKYSNKDIGATLGNIATIGAGAVGAINGVSAALQLVGVEGEDAEKALKNIQLTMALIQGLSSIDTAIKAVKGLSVAFKGLNGERIAQTGATAGAAAAETAEIVALKENTKKTYENIEAAGEYNEVQKQNTQKTNDSTEALYKEAGGLQAVAEARRNDFTKLEQYRAELAKLQEQQAVDVEVGGKMANKGLNDEIKDYENRIKNLLAEEKLLKDKGRSANDRDLKYVQDLILAYQLKIEGLKAVTEDTSEAIMTNFEHLLKDGFACWSDEIESEMEAMIEAMSPEQLEQLPQVFEDVKKSLQANAENGVGMWVNDLDEELESIDLYLERVGDELDITISSRRKQIEQEKVLKAQIDKTTKSIDKETAAENANTKAKQQNAGATNGLAGAEGNLNKSMTASIPLQTKIATGFKNMGKAIGDFIAANPILLMIVGAIGAIVGAMALFANATKKALKDVREMMETTAQLNHTYEDQTVRLNVLLNTAQDETQSLNERKKAVEELNKIVPNYNAQLDETTGEYTASATALQHYIDKLKEKIELEAYEGKIKELLQARLDLEQKLIQKQTNGWNIFGIKVRKLKKEIKETDDQIEKLYGRIQDLYLPWALDENKVDTAKTVKTVVKTFKEAFAQLKTMYENLWNTIFDEKELRLTFNGVYSETDIMLSKIRRIIKSKDLGKYLSDDFKKALKDGLPDDMNYQITLDWVFDKKQSQDFYNELLKENNKLVQMMNSKKPVSDEELKKQQEVIDKLKEEEANRKLVMEATQKYFEQRRKEADETEKLIVAKEQYLKQLEIERTYRYEKRGGNEYADINKEIAQNEELVKQIEDRMVVRQGELNWLKMLPDQNKQVTERIKQLNQEQIDDEKAKNTALANIDEQYYQERLKYVELYYKDVKDYTEKATADLENNRTLKGWGVVDYNTQLDILKMSLQAIKDTMDETAAYYDREIELAADNAEKRIELEAEKLEALRKLNEDYSAQEIEIEKAKVDRKIAIQQTYTNAMDSITGEIQSLLQTQMANYNQNSKQYKKLAVANGIIDVTKGTLSAFMSGIESGVPAPWNLLVAGIMSGIVFATGMAQLNNIKNATAANATSGSNNISFGSYDTMTYAQNSDILSSIADQRVYVLESDITSTQNRVQVTESNATF